MKRFIPFVLLLGIFGCERIENGSTDPGPMIIYKTRQDYSDYIFVTLTEDKSKVSTTPTSDIDSSDFPVFSLSDGYQTSLICLIISILTLK